MGTSDRTGPPWYRSYRWLICGLLFFATTLRDEIGWSDQEYGVINSAFTLAYAIERGGGKFFRVASLAPSPSAIRQGTPPRQPEHYTRRRPERTPLYRVVSRHFETCLAERSLGEHPVETFVEEEFRAYLRCGILSFGFARARCGSCGHDFLIAFSCKGQGICPSCNGRRMAQTAAHLVDHVIPPVPVRQWVISVPKRLRYFLAARHRDGNRERRQARRHHTFSPCGPSGPGPG